MKKGQKLVLVLLVVVLLMSVFVTPVAAGRERGNDRGPRNVPPQKVQYLDAEVKVIGGQPVIIAETRRGYVNTPVALPVVFSVDGQTIPLQRQGNGVVIPTEDRAVVVSLEEFAIVSVNGQVMLSAEENPLILIPVAAFAGIGWATGAGLAKVLGTGKAVTAFLKTSGAISGGFTGYVTGRAAGL